MRKSDLKDGMIVEYRNGERKFVFENVFYGLNGFASFECYDDNLLAKDLTTLFDIVKVYKKTRDSFGSMLKDSKLELIWERDETDWSKVPFGTRVRVWDFENDIRLEGKFLGYNEEHNHPYNVFVDTTKSKIWRNCELMEEPITYEEIYENYTSECDKWNDDHKSCQGCDNFANDCAIQFILNKYNVTRK